MSASDSDTPTPDGDAAELDREARQLTREMAAECLGMRSRAVSRAITRLFDDELRPHGLRATQFLMVGAIQNLGPISTTELAANMALDRSTLSRALRPLIEAGWIELEPAEGRRRSVQMRDAGRRLLIAASADWRRAQARARELLGEQAADQLRRLGTELIREQSRIDLG